jgi:cholesterol transport system auxiliary component
VRSIAGVVLLALATGACAALGIGEKDALPAFNLRAPDALPRLGAIRGQLVISEPTAVSVLDSERIVVRPSAGQVATLGGAQWSDRLPKLLQARLIETFENSNRLRSVGRPTDGLSSDYQLLVDVRTFQLTAVPAPAGEVEIAARIVSARSGRIVAGRVFRATTPAAGNDGAAAVAAIEASFQNVAVQLMQWVTRVI